MQRLNKEEQEQQKKVADPQQELQANIPAPLPDELVAALKHVGVTEPKPQTLSSSVCKTGNPPGAGRQGRQGDRRSQERSRCWDPVFVSFDPTVRWLGSKDPYQSGGLVQHSGHVSSCGAGTPGESDPHLGRATHQWMYGHPPPQTRK